MRAARGHAGLGSVSQWTTQLTGTAFVATQNRFPFSSSREVVRVRELNSRQQGRNQGVLCTPQMQQDICEYMQLSNHLYRALERNELVLHYQPQIHVDSRSIIGTEALVRWEHPGLGLASPLSNARPLR